MEWWNNDDWWLNTAYNKVYIVTASYQELTYKQLYLHILNQLIQLRTGVAEFNPNGQTEANHHDYMYNSGSDYQQYLNQGMQELLQDIEDYWDYISDLQDWYDYEGEDPGGPGSEEQDGPG